MLITTNNNLFISNIYHYIVLEIIYSTLYRLKMSWTEEKVAKLKELWGKNTASQIAEIIGGISRNAVIGRILPL